MTNRSELARAPSPPPSNSAADDRGGDAHNHYDRPDYENLADLTRDAIARVALLKDLAAESRALWEQVGQDIADMRRLSPRHAVVRRRWMDEAGLGSFGRPAQVSSIVKWGADRQEVEGAVDVSPFTTTPQAIMAAYYKVQRPQAKKKPPAEQESDDYMYEQMAPENPYSVDDVAFTHSGELDRNVAKVIRDARKQGADEVEATQFALVWAHAEARKAHEAMISALRRRETEGLPDDPDEDF